MICYGSDKPLVFFFLFINNLAQSQYVDHTPGVKNNVTDSKFFWQHNLTFHSRDYYFIINNTQ